LSVCYPNAITEVFGSEFRNWFRLFGSVVRSSPTKSPPEVQKALEARIAVFPLPFLSYLRKRPSYEESNHFFCSWNRGRVRNHQLRNLFEGGREAPSLYSDRGRIRRDSNRGSEDDEALQADRHDPLVALGEYMTAAEIALGQLKRVPNDLNALHDYNFAVARIIAVIRDAKLDPWTRPLSVPASNGTFVLAVLGVDLTKVTILAGAFTVGVGFGL
jgi:hypothetical protein